MLHQKSPHVLCVTQRLRNSELIDPSFQWHGPKGKIISAYREPHYYYQFTARYHAAPCNSIYNISFEKKLLQILSKLVLDLSCEVSLLKSECHRVKMQRAGLQNELFFTFSVGCHFLYISPPSCASPPFQPSRSSPNKSHGFDACVGKMTWRRKWQPTPVFLPGKSHGHVNATFSICPPGHSLHLISMSSLNRFINCFEESFHAEDKLHLIVVYDPFNVFLESVC
ncbi:hypothetical protein FD755_012927 [Muntiacus reevesi]|uniref:Zona-pellucida-binding protein 1/2 N-terminal domain-containing protein n=1 Tax=Muntiacus reevesi TaxID=9886 RepID=A0A5N3XQA6_MUNRE|nr:hypothetical protein FD755_012927 [Muntiacus reevesi]